MKILKIVLLLLFALWALSPFGFAAEPPDRKTAANYREAGLRSSLECVAGEFAARN